MARARDWSAREDHLHEIRECTPPRTIPWHLHDGSSAHAQLLEATERLEAQAAATEETPAGDERLGQTVAGWRAFAERRMRMRLLAMCDAAAPPRLDWRRAPSP